MLAVIPLALVFYGDATCPAPASVAERVARIGEIRTADRIRVESDALGVTLELHAPSGNVVEKQQIANAGSCESRADAAAIVVSNWYESLIATSRLPKPTPPVVTPPIMPPIASPAPPPRIVYAIEVGALSAINRSVAFGGWTQFTLASRRYHFGGHVGAFATDFRSTALAIGHAEWLHAGLFVGPVWRVPWKNLRFDLSADLYATLLATRGGGFSTDQTAYDSTFGLGPSAQVAYAIKKLTLFVGVSGVGWFRNEVVTSTQPVASSTLPHYDIFLRLGLGWGTF